MDATAKITGGPVQSGLRGAAFKKENVLETDLSQATHLYIYSPVRSRDLIRALVERIGAEASQRPLTVIAGYDSLVNQLKLCPKLVPVAEEFHRTIFVSHSFPTAWNSDCDNRA